MTRAQGLCYGCVSGGRGGWPPFGSFFFSAALTIFPPHWIHIYLVPRRRLGPLSPSLPCPSIGAGRTSRQPGAGCFAPTLPGYLFPPVSQLLLRSPFSVPSVVASSPGSPYTTLESESPGRDALGTLASYQCRLPAGVLSSCLRPPPSSRLDPDLGTRLCPQSLDPRQSGCPLSRPSSPRRLAG